MKSSMIDYMHDLQRYRIKDDRRTLKQARKDLAIQQWHYYRQRRLENPFMPSPVDILEWDEVKSIAKLPSEVDVPIERFENLFDKYLPKFLEDWRKLQTTTLSASCSRHIPGPQVSHNISRIELAVCVFTCEGQVHELEPDFDPDAYSPMWYPEFLHHSCNSICIKFQGNGKQNAILDRNIKVAVKQRFEYCRRKAWSPELLRFDEKASRVVRSILKGCSLDHTTTSTAMLDELDPRLVCLKCSFGAKPDGERQFSVWSWRSAVGHIVAT
jgi:hypothetical protein